MNPSVQPEYSVILEKTGQYQETGQATTRDWSQVVIDLLELSQQVTLLADISGGIAIGIRRLVQQLEEV